MRRFWCVVVCWLVWGPPSGVSVMCGAGPLAPPPGPIAPTARPLAEIEPRTALGPTTTPGDLNAVYVIAQPGSYFLAGDLDVPAGRVGVRIEASDVRLDLGGFAIRGQAGAADGVRIVDSGDGVAGGAGSVANGSISAFAGSGVAGANASLRLTSLDVTDTGGDAIVVGPRSLVDRCRVQVGGDRGIVVGSHALVTRCATFDMDQIGIELGADAVALECVAVNQRFGFRLGAGARVEGCWATNSIVVGIEAGDRAAVTRCAAALGFVGIRAAGTGARIEENQVVNNGIGIEAVNPGNLIIRNVAHVNGTAISAAAGNTVGPIVDESTVLLINSPAANYDY